MDLIRANLGEGGGVSRLLAAFLALCSSEEKTPHPVMQRGKRPEPEALAILPSAPRMGGSAGGAAAVGASRKKKRLRRWRSRPSGPEGGKVSRAGAAPNPPCCGARCPAGSSATRSPSKVSAGLPGSPWGRCAASPSAWLVVWAAGASAVRLSP